jgi:uncharacterized alkaline shock family protein YloU
MTESGPPQTLQYDIPPAEGMRQRLGATRVANEVVAQIAALTALDVPGVHAMYHAGGSQQIDRILRRGSAHKGVRVEMLPDDSLRLDLYVVMEAGTDLPRMGGEVQRRTAENIDKQLGLELAEINVFISEVNFG